MGKPRLPSHKQNSVAILGTGLIGTSIGLALRATKDRPTVVGWDPKRAALEAARASGGIQRGAKSMRAAIKGAKVIIIAAPLDGIEATLPDAVAAADPGSLVMDVGAVKSGVEKAAQRALRARTDVRFVGGHPMAGRERSGAGHASAGLFAGCPFVLVAPRQRYRSKALAEAQALVRSIGGLPVSLSARAHDRLVAATSALPQLASIALACAVQASAGPGARGIAGTGYRDATRLALSPFTIWRPAIAANRAAVRRALRCLQTSLRRLISAVERGDDQALAREFSRAVHARRRVVAD